MPKKMILITSLDVWLLAYHVKKPGAGNQSLYNTLLGYARAGWEVHMLTNSMVLSDMPPIHKRVIIHRKPLANPTATSIVKALAKTLGGGPKPGVGPRTVTTAPKLPSGMHRLHAHVFRRVMAHRAVKLARKVGGVDFIYGHEIHGAGAVVTRGFPTGSVIAGVPAKVISIRGEEPVRTNEKRRGRTG